jgi:hypothetical protein
MGFSISCKFPQKILYGATLAQLFSLRPFFCAEQTLSSVSTKQGMIAANSGCQPPIVSDPTFRADSVELLKYFDAP